MALKRTVGNRTGAVNHPTGTERTANMYCAKPKPRNSRHGKTATFFE